MGFKLWIKEHKTDVATGAGIIGMIVTTVLSCRQTLKIEHIKIEAEEKEDHIDKVLSGEIKTQEEYTEEDAKKDRMIVKTQKYANIVKLYIAPGAIGAVSVALLLWSHNLLRKENIALAGAFTGLTEAFNEYRKRVRNDIGAEKDREYFTGVKTEEQVVVDEETGKTTVEKQSHIVADSVSIYAKEFDESNPNFNGKSHAQNLYFLQRAEKYFTDKLRAHGHLFLNEVYDYLRMPRTYEGQFVGWVTGMGDDFVDFGIEGYLEELRDGGAYHNDIPVPIRLDFNVDGEILYIFKKIHGDDYAEKLIKE